MILQLIFAAQILAATPATTPTPVIVAGTGQTRTLADVARERKLGKKGVVGGTMSVAGAALPVQPKGAAAPVLGAAPAFTIAGMEAEWRGRYTACRAELDVAQTEMERADGTMPSVVSRSGRGLAAVANEAREAGLLPYRMRVASAQAACDAVQEAARLAGASPGWVR
jgi:hypothetical protein